MKPFMQWVVRHRIAVLVAVGLITVLLGSQIRYFGHYTEGVASATIHAFERCFLLGFRRMKIFLS